MVPLTPAEELAVAGPYREVFLAGLKPEVAAALQQAGEFTEAALYEAFGAAPSNIPFDILFGRAALVDLEALVRHLGDLADGSGETVQEHRYRDDLTEVLSLLRQAEARLARTLAEAEERRPRALRDAGPRLVRRGAGGNAAKAQKAARGDL